MMTVTMCQQSLSCILPEGGLGRAAPAPRRECCRREPPIAPPDETP